MAKQFKKALREAGKLKGVQLDPLRQAFITDLLFAVQFEVDLYDEGDDGAVSDVTPHRKFIKKWKDA